MKLLDPNGGTVESTSQSSPSSQPVSSPPAQQADGTIKVGGVVYNAYIVPLPTEIAYSKWHPTLKGDVVITQGNHAGSFLNTPVQKYNGKLYAWPNNRAFSVVSGSVSTETLTGQKGGSSFWDKIGQWAAKNTATIAGITTAVGVSAAAAVAVHDEMKGKDKAKPKRGRVVRNQDWSLE
jgi:hypothetical protein